MKKRKLMFIKNVFFQRLNLGLFFLISSSIVSYCVFLRGLESDGVEDLAIIMARNDFFFPDRARFFFHFLYQLPIVFFLKAFPVASLHLIKVVWSFSLLWVHLFSFFGCYLILPKHKKYFILFPLISFILGPMTSLGLSISVSFIVSSYIWMTAFIIYYSNLSLKSHKFIFILSLFFSFFSHEMMSYMAWPLIYLCFSKIQKTEKNKLLIFIGIFLLLINSLLSSFFVIFPRYPAHRSYFIESLTHLSFFYKNGFYAPIVSSCLLLILFFIKLYFKKNKIHLKKQNVIIIFISIFFIFFCLMSFVYPIYPVFGDLFSLWNKYDKRVWVVISLPLTLLIWWFFETKKISFPDFRYFFLFCGFLAFSLTGWRIGTDYRFYQYTKQFSNRLSYCFGYVSWSEVEKSSSPFEPYFLNKFHDPEEHIINMSIFYSDSFDVKSIVQSDFKPLWLCSNFFSPKRYLLDTHKVDFAEFIQKSCQKTINMTDITLYKFRFSQFIEFVKSQKSFCEKSSQ